MNIRPSAKTHIFFLPFSWTRDMILSLTDKKPLSSCSLDSLTQCSIHLNDNVLRCDVTVVLLIWRVKDCGKIMNIAMPGYPGTILGMTSFPREMMKEKGFF